LSHINFSKTVFIDRSIGFDLVGEEAKGRPIKDFIPELLKFQDNCASEGVEIPFLFHCGETLDMGTDTDGNLVDALLLKSKRIGHGFALAKHPYVMQHMKERGICLELCPISNEILGLTPRVSGHTMYQLLANNVHCTVSSDNGTLFRSSLSHDFYQVMVGKADMGLFGWKQLVLWSLEHACLSESERSAVVCDWEQKWKEFVDWVIETYGTERSLI
jgi:adenosine deaminase CECR1